MRPLIAAVVSCALVFGGGEWAARAWISRYGDALDITRGILQVDGVLGWKQRAHLHTTFLGLPLSTNELGWRIALPADQATTSVLILGPSSTFGWGVAEEDTYSAQLQTLVGASTTVLNAGEIGFSTYQGMKLYQEPAVASLRPAAVVIAYGVNDLDRSRFYFQSDDTDEQAFSAGHSSIQIAALNAFYDSALLDVFSKAASEFRAAYAAPPVPYKPPRDPVPPVRVPLDDSMANIRTIIETARARGANPILLTTWTNDPDVPLRPEAQALFEKGKEAWSRSDTDGARSFMQEAIASDATLTDAYYYLAAAEAAENNDAQARQYFVQARASEPYRIARDVDAYNAALAELAREEKVPLIDIRQLFAGKPDDALFVSGDAIHFSKAGNVLVASGIDSILRLQGATNTI